MPTKRQPLDLSIWLSDTEGNYAYLIASEIEAQLTGMFADDVNRTLNWATGCQGFIFYKDIPKDWKPNKSWMKHKIQLNYDSEGILCSSNQGS